VKVLIEIDEMAGAENPEVTQKLIVSSLATMSGVKSCEPYPEKSPLAQLLSSFKNAVRYVIQLGEGSITLK